MPTPKKTPHSISEATLEKLRGENAAERMIHRLHSVVLVLSGVPAKDVAQFFGDSPRAVAYWVKSFQAQGAGSLEDRKRSGRPPRLNALQMKNLRSFVEVQKRSNKPVNAAALSAHIKASFNISLTERQCWRILKELV